MRPGPIPTTPIASGVQVGPDDASCTLDELRVGRELPPIVVPHDGYSRHCACSPAFQRLRTLAAQHAEVAHPQRAVTDISTIEVFYNRIRRHSALGIITPVANDKLHARNTGVA